MLSSFLGKFRIHLGEFWRGVVTYVLAHHQSCTTDRLVTEWKVDIFLTEICTNVREKYDHLLPFGCILGGTGSPKRPSTLVANRPVSLDEVALRLSRPV
jgi:hypothetical protein